MKMNKLYGLYLVEYGDMCGREYNFLCCSDDADKLIKRIDEYNKQTSNKLLWVNSDDKKLYNKLYNGNDSFYLIEEIEVLRNCQ